LYRISPQGDVRARHSGYTLLCCYHVSNCNTQSRITEMRPALNYEYWLTRSLTLFVTIVTAVPVVSYRAIKTYGGVKVQDPATPPPLKQTPPPPNNNINDTSECVASLIRLRVTPASKLGSKTKQPRVFDIFPSRSMKMPEDYLKLRHGCLLPIIIHNSVIIIIQYLGRRWGWVVSATPRPQYAPKWDPVPILNRQQMHI